MTMTETHAWFYADRNQTFGPVDAQEIEGLIRQSVISSSTWMLAEGSENWLLATDSPFAAHLVNILPRPEPPNQSPAGSAADLVQVDSPPSDGLERPGEGLFAKLSQFGSAVLSETKKNARLASIKAVIEKLKHVDLTKAHYALGRKAYELKIDQDRFSDQYRGILELEETIRIKRAGTAADESATMLQTFRGATINTKSAVEAEAFEIKRKQWLIKVGREYQPSSVPTGIETEFDAVEKVEAQIKECEAGYASVSADRISILKLRCLAWTILKTVGVQAKSVWPNDLMQLNRNTPRLGGWRPAMIFGLLTLLCTIFVFHHYRGEEPGWQPLSDEKTQTTPPSSPATSDSLIPAIPPSSQTSATTLIVKGLYVGMPGEEAKKAIIVDGHGKITLRPTTRYKEHGYDILLQTPDVPSGSMQGGIWTDPKDGTVTVFFFYKKLGDLLFNTEDQPPQEFAQTFINAYNIPKVTPTTFSGMQCWSYVSPYGWTLRIMIDKTVDLSKTPDRNFD